ncbi:FAD/NAD(P)-binding protein [Lysinibacter sp. HNR]|uniref:FAD/NAD(P)-binding protein n=1 Tax=Lysinibacter sp. HNR TaxID=3031408 RepID=UPI002435098A|nr:FAD/NAD(P)-binding protein [Lysinibacter sp. HNR]WGD37068.1 FAD/NAD(P)-binding protein [Lysinibacter sp. HNR]
MTRIAIIGAGGSGTAAALALADLPDVEHLEVFEEKGGIGGEAFDTPDQGHLCNTSVAGMSLRADDDFHFSRWLGGNNNSPLQEQFVPRQLYRNYLRSSLENLRLGNSGQQVNITNEKVSKIFIRDTGVALVGSSQNPHEFDEVVLAPGLSALNRPSGITDRSTSLREYNSPYDPGFQRFLQEHPGSVVGVLGTKLSAIDAARSVLAASSRVVMVSPSGQLPAVRKENPLGSPFPIGIRRFKDWSSSPQRFCQGLSNYLAQFGENYGKSELLGERVEESASSQLRSDIVAASEGKSHWQLAVGEFVDLANEHWSELSSRKMFALKKAIYRWIVRYVSAMPLENAILLDLAFREGSLVVHGSDHFIHRGDKKFELHGPGRKIEELDALVWAAGFKSSNWKFDGRSVLELAGDDEEVGALPVSRRLAVERSSGKPLPHIWAVGNTTRGRYPIVNAIRTSVLQAHDLKSRFLAAAPRRFYCTSSASSTSHKILRGE